MNETANHDEAWRLVEEMRKKILYLRNNMPQWKLCGHQLPDSDVTVLVFCPESVEPVWLGFYDGEDWRSIDSIRQQLRALLPQANLVRVFCPGVAAMSEAGASGNAGPTTSSLGEAVQICVSWQKERSRLGSEAVLASAGAGVA